MNNRIRLASVLLFFFFLAPAVHAQLDKITMNIDKDKPVKYKDNILRSEKTGQKKFTVPRRFIQNTVSHYNYFYNANRKIDYVIERARLANVDDYSKLLWYYGYTLDNTASQKTDLDSVIYKATAGILLHDLRSDWVDNLYLLIGEAYYFRKDFDSSWMTFQFINYNLFPRGRKGNDDQLVVGTNDNSSNNSLSISSNEKENIIKKTFSRPPSRNDALVWQIRALTDQGKYPEAAGLINTLRNDPLFPKRLHPYFEELEGYWFFKQQMYDSAVAYINSALPNSIDNADRARREYLLAQLYELNGHQDTASYYYDKAIKQTTDPLMDIYANLNKAKMLKSKDSAEIEKGIGRLLHMAHKDKFELYRDIIYSSAGELALEKPDTSEAVSFYKKSTFYNKENITLKNKAFLTLAEISYHQEKYRDAYNYYDSLQSGDTSLTNAELQDILSRKNALAKVVTNLNIIQREDSLQTIAALSPADRTAFLKKLSKELKKERGLKDEEGGYGYGSDYLNKKSQSSNIFSNNSSAAAWYFDNNDLKGQGYNEFKSTWGKRKNVDNWRRSSSADQNSAVNQNESNSVLGDPMTQTQSGKEKINLGIPVQNDISIEGLLANVPLTKIAMDTSNSKIARSLFQLGKNYQELLEDYKSAIETYLNSLKRFPDSLHNGELYLNLSYCYRKIGNIQQADFYKNLLLNKFQKTVYAQYVLHPDSFNPSEKDTVASHRYDEIYNLFIEGRFDSALQEKHVADSLYGKSYWNPQLLYIQSVYYIQKRQDSAAIETLHEIVNNYPKSPMKERAAKMIEVLGKRASIEKYLTNLNVVRENPDSQVVVYDDARIINNVQSPVITEQKPILAKGIVKAGTATLNPNKKLPPPVKNAEFIFDPNEAQNVMMILTKVDPVYSSEARNAFDRYNSQNNYSSNIQIVKDTLDTSRILLIFSPFIDADVAMKYMQQLKAAALSEISWLPPQKYAFYIISDANLLLLKDKKNLQSYIDLLNKKYPGKF